MIILYVLIGLLVGGLGIYLLLRPKLKVVAQTNLDLAVANDKLKEENKNLENIKKHREELLQSVQAEYYKMDAKRKELNQTINDLKET